MLARVTFFRAKSYHARKHGNESSTEKSLFAVYFLSNNHIETEEALEESTDLQLGYMPILTDKLTSALFLSVFSGLANTTGSPILYDFRDDSVIFSKQF